MPKQWPILQCSVLLPVNRLYFLGCRPLKVLLHDTSHSPIHSYTDDIGCHVTCQLLIKKELIHSHAFWSNTWFSILPKDNMQTRESQGSSHTSNDLLISGRPALPPYHSFRHVTTLGHREYKILLNDQSSWALLQCAFIISLRLRLVNASWFMCFFLFLPVPWIWLPVGTLLTAFCPVLCVPATLLARLWQPHMCILDGLLCRLV